MSNFRITSILLDESTAETLLEGIIECTPGDAAAGPREELFEIEEVPEDA